MSDSRAIPGVTVESLRGAAIEPVLDDVARLRISVFREFPYLYEGALDYEAKYLRAYVNDDSVVVVARREGVIVGVSTAMPLTLHSDDVVPAFERAGMDPARIYYFGESVLDRSARGLGIGHAFFDHREAAARALGRFTHTSFCAVVRPVDHPARPTDYAPHDAFWTKRGYSKRPDMIAEFRWRDVGDAEETEKPMVFWLRALDADGRA